jgi:electron transfer flavoprotein-quinone oxidoreductase
MSEEKFDAIVVGAGVAGCVAGYVMANAGLDVLVIERGNFAGSKNMTGGRLYAHSLEKIMPGFADEAPVERCVTHEKVSFLTNESAVTLDYLAEKSDSASQKSYTVLRSKFDQWLMEKAEAAGVQFIPGVRVESLLTENGRVTGVQAGEDALEANVVILADGVNSLLGQSIGLSANVNPHTVAVGAKELISLPKKTIEDRFNLEPGEGAAWLFAGAPSDGMMGGGFLYTNEDTISLGIVCGLADIGKSTKSVPQLLEDFKQHPVIRPLIEGGTLVEYSGHMVPEGGLSMMPELAADGAMVVGDAAGMCLNLGFTIRGMDLAIASGEAAALAAIDAKNSGDYSKNGLSGYRKRLEDSFVLKDMTRYQKLPGFLDNPRMFVAYPQMAADVMSDLFTINGEPSQSMMSKMYKRVKQVGILNLLKDGFKGSRVL